MSYFERALLVGAIIGVLCGVVGTVVVLRRRVFFTQALTHATFPGAMLAAVLGVHVLAGAGVFGLLLVGVMLALERVPRQGAQVATGVVLAGGFALGMVLQALNPQVPIQPEAFLVGTILYVGADAPVLAAVALVIAVVVLWVIRRPLLFSTFDADGFRASGGREWVVEAVVLGVVVLTVVTALPAGGAILSIALIAAPASAARVLSRSVRTMFVLAPVLGAAAAVAGVYLSRLADVSAGGTIALVAGAEFVLALAIRAVVARRRANRIGIGSSAASGGGERAAQNVAA